MPHTAPNDSGSLADIRTRVRGAVLRDEAQAVHRNVASCGLSAADREQVVAHAVELVVATRAVSHTGVMQSFLVEYGLSTREGVALMCLAEALLRVPDAETIDALIEDKVGASDWGTHLGHSSSPLVNASTWALLLTGKVLSDADEGLVGVLRTAIRRLGEPVIRTAVAQAMKELGHQFVLGRNIEEAKSRAQRLEALGLTYSYDMLGEAARTEADARRYHLSYSDAITALAGIGAARSIRDRPGMSVKLSALHARYELAQKPRVMNELVARARSLAVLAKSAGIGLNIDAEEADRLDLSLDVIEAVLSDLALAGWDGFGVVVQAYGKRAPDVIDWLYALATKLDRHIMVRLVKGAYWDTEIKRAQVLGLDGFPVYTRKANTDVSFLACAAKLLGMTDRIYPQFATHNAHTMAAVFHQADDLRAFEFQRLHGMGEDLHDAVMNDRGTRCRIYAPVGAHEDLLAYLVRRLLENGANSSFVNQIVDLDVSPQEIARDPLVVVEELRGALANPRITPPSELYGSSRRNARGFDITDPLVVAEVEQRRAEFKEVLWNAEPTRAASAIGGPQHDVFNPARRSERVGTVTCATASDIDAALSAARGGFAAWSARPAAERAAHVARVADLYEQHAAELFALAAREAGKTWLDCVGEVREAVDFARFYAGEAVRVAGQGQPRGVIACISPWNFPLAIFSGQILAAVAAGNAVVAKPAEQSALIAARAVALMHEAGIPADVVQLLPGDGAGVGAALVRDARVDGVCFTGSTHTGRQINAAMANTLAPDAPLLAETGGLNAMIVDSTALPEQAVRDIVASAFQSAGQRCSALRMLYIQEDVEERILRMLFGAMDELRLGNPWDFETDIGPVIDAPAKARIDAHCAAFAQDGQLLKQLEPPSDGFFVAPTVLRVSGIEELTEEIFGPVLHIATFHADAIDSVVDAINAKGYGLTFGVHTRIDDRVQQIVERVRVGNIYVNRNQIGAVVGSQPFGGEGLSGTGPKAGGPHYVQRFLGGDPYSGGIPKGLPVSGAALQAALDSVRGVTAEPANFPPRDLPGPTGESNRLSYVPRGVVLCLGVDVDALREQVNIALATGNAVVAVAADARQLLSESIPGAVRLRVLNGCVDAHELSALDGVDAVACCAEEAVLRGMRIALAQRPGALIPLITQTSAPERYILERHVCVDTTAAGGNASLLAAADA